MKMKYSLKETMSTNFSEKKLIYLEHFIHKFATKLKVYTMFPAQSVKIWHSMGVRTENLNN